MQRRWIPSAAISGKTGRIMNTLTLHHFRASSWTAQPRTHCQAHAQGSTQKVLKVKFPCLNKKESYNTQHFRFLCRHPSFINPKQEEWNTYPLLFKAAFRLPKIKVCSVISLRCQTWGYNTTTVYYKLNICSLLSRLLNKGNSFFMNENYF